ncbi:drug/metabolite transporter permease [Klebsiella pneumoniae]|uniref:Drug/metabolite transporter permease n=1 Tax=Klebsiella pneumoniae TaxID=573 RepID=A0A2X3CBZ1_KLEPN|nr:drug/metabolite transporter permease [Klebsiella pneumoniae]
MVRQRQADLLLIAATVIAACGWIFSREAIAGMPVFAFLGLRFFFAALLLLPFCRRFSPAKAALAKTHHQRTLVCAQPLPVDLFGLHDGVARRRGVYHEPVDDVRPADRMGDDEGAPAARLVGVPADRGGRPGAAQSAYADSLPPQPGLVFADGAGAVDLVLLHQPLRA